MLALFGFAQRALRKQRRGGVSPAAKPPSLFDRSPNRSFRSYRSAFGEHNIFASLFSLRPLRETLSWRSR